MIWILKLGDPLWFPVLNFSAWGKVLAFEEKKGC